MSRKLLWEFLFIGLLLGLTVPAFAGEVSWIQLSLSLDYQDSFTQCHDRGFLSNFALVLDESGTNVGRAELRAERGEYFNGEEPPVLAALRRVKFPAPPVLPLTAEEIKGITFGTDDAGRRWLRKLSLDARVLVWLLHPAESRMGCKPNFPQTTATPQSVAFEFEWGGLNEGIPISYSELTPFNLYRWDGRQWFHSDRAVLRLRQTEYNQSAGTGVSYAH